MLTNSDIESKSYNISFEDIKDVLKTIKATGEVTEAYSTTWFRVFLVLANSSSLQEADNYLCPMVKDEVLQGITDPLERNRLTSFHRVAKHLVKKYLELQAAGVRMPSARATTKADIIREWNKRVKPVTDPVTDLRSALTKITKQAHTLAGEGIDIEIIKDDMQAFINS